MYDIISLISIATGLAGFVEWRIRTMYAQLDDKIKDKNEVNEVIQQELKNDIARLESKIDMLIQLQIKRGNYANKKIENS